jgi:hypothetical protein
MIILYLGIVFIAASIHRFFLKSARKEELEIMKLPKHFDIFIYVFEFIVGVLLLSSAPLFYKKVVLGLLLVFLLVGCGLILAFNFKKLIATYKDVFTFQPTAMSYCMHVAYVVMIISVIF